MSVLESARAMYFGDELKSVAMFILDQWRTGKATNEKARAKWLNALAAAICRYRLSSRQLNAALAPVHQAIVRVFGAAPPWLMHIDLAAYNELARRGACPELQESVLSRGKKMAIAGAALMLGVLFVGAIAARR